MAVDKLVDSTQLDADLTSVANAIRTKGGTSGQLAFPSGFVSAVEAIPTGGGGTDYTVRQVNVTSNNPTVTRDFNNFIFIAQAAADELPETPPNNTAYYLEFAYVDGALIRKSGGKCYVVKSDGSSTASGASNLSIGNTSITFSSYSSQVMLKVNWNVLQIEVPSDFSLYSFASLT